MTISFTWVKIMRDEELIEVVSDEKQQKCGEVICIVALGQGVTAMRFPNNNKFAKVRMP